MCSWGRASGTEERSDSLFPGNFNERNKDRKPTRKRSRLPPVAKFLIPPFYKRKFKTRAVSHRRFERWNSSPRMYPPEVRKASYNIISTLPRFTCPTQWKRNTCFMEFYTCFGRETQSGVVYVFWLFFTIGLCSATSFKRPWRELFDDVTGHRSMLKKKIKFALSRFSFPPKTGIAFPKTGIDFIAYPQSSSLTPLNVISLSNRYVRISAVCLAPLVLTWLRDGKWDEK